MLYDLGEFGKHVEITGYRNVSFAKAEEFLKNSRKQTQAAAIQFFDAQLIATPEHLYFAVLNAFQAFKGKTTISKSPAMETMLYASAQRQIKKAVERCGITPKTTSMAVVVVGDSAEQIEALMWDITECIGAEPDETVLEMSWEKAEIIRKVFEISDREIKTVTDGEDCERAIVNLVLERVALLAIQL